MAQYITRRVLSAIPILVAVVTIVFVLMRMVPGGPASALLGDYASATAIKTLEHKLGLDKPLWQQYTEFIGQVSRGNFGVSIFNGKPVGEQLIRALPFTAGLCGATVIVGLLLGVPIGIVTAVYRNSLWDYIGRVLSLTGLSIPVFYLGILLIMGFSIRVRVFPMMGGGELGNIFDFAYHLILPSLTLGIVMSAFVSRSVRSSLLEVLLAEYVTTARAKGLPEERVLLKHAFRNALIPTVAFLAIYITLLLGGTVVVEVLFSRPGLGRLLVNAMKQRDYPVLQTTLMVFSAIVACVNLFVDLVYAYIDPRIRYA